MRKEAAIIRVKILIQNARNALYKLERELDKLEQENATKGAVK